jgi:uncharacterized membrane protein YeaQ/YmgE (transglycosylase-associated protein family)
MLGPDRLRFRATSHQAPVPLRRRTASAARPGRPRHSGPDFSRGEARRCYCCDPYPALGQSMSIIGTIVIGFFVGLIARFLKPGRDKMGLILTTVLGIVGALVATWIGQALGWYDEGEAAGFIMSVIGAIVVLAVWGLATGRKRR